MTTLLLVGADVHRDTNTICMMDAQGRELTPRFTIPNNRHGCETLVHEVARQVADGDFDAIQLAAEATGWYWWHFFQTLDRAPTLQQVPVELYALNPRLTASFTKTYVDRDHTDHGDAFVQVTDMFFRPRFAFFIIELASRRVIHVGVTCALTDAWVAQQLHEATPYGTGPRYLIRDNDGKFGSQFAGGAAGSGIEVLRTPIHAPKAMLSANGSSAVSGATVWITS